MRRGLLLVVVAAAVVAVALLARGVWYVPMTVAETALPPAPSPARLAAALAGLGLWLGGAVHFAHTARPSAASAGMVAVGLLVWAAALYNP